MATAMEFVAAFKMVAEVGMMGGLGLLAGAGIGTAFLAHAMMGDGSSPSTSSSGVGSTPGSEFSGPGTGDKKGKSSKTYEIKIGNRQLGKAIADTTAKTNVKARNYQ